MLGKTYACVEVVTLPAEVSSVSCCIETLVNGYVVLLNVGVITVDGTEVKGPGEVK